MISLKDISEIDFYVKIKNPFFRKMLEDLCGDRPVSNRNLSKKLGVGFSEKYNKSYAIYGWYYCGNCIPMRKLSLIVNLSKKYTWKDVESNLIGITTSGHGKPCFIKPKFPIEMNKLLGSIVGHILGDGSIDRKYSQVFFSNTNKELLEEFIENMRTVFGAEPRIWLQKSGNFRNKTIWLRRMTSTQEYNGYSFGLFYPSSIGTLINFIFDDFVRGRTKNITEKIKNANKNFKTAFIRAFFDDEGTVDVKSQQIRVFQDSPDTLIEIKKMLLNLGIVSNPIHHYYKHRKKRHYFNITGLENYRNFYYKIGFTSPEKEGKLFRMMENVDVKGKRRLAKGRSREIIMWILKKKCPRTAGNIAKELRKLKPDIKWNTNTIYKHLNSMKRSRALESKISDKDNKTYLWYLK